MLGVAGDASGGSLTEQLHLLRSREASPHFLKGPSIKSYLANKIAPEYSMVGSEFVWTKIFGELSVLPNSTHLPPSMDFSEEDEEQKKSPKRLVFLHKISS